MLGSSDGLCDLYSVSTVNTSEFPTEPSARWSGIVGKVSVKSWQGRMLKNDSQSFYFAIKNVNYQTRLVFTVSQLL